MADRQSSSNRDYQMLFGLWILGLVLSGFRPTDRLTWLLEIFPVVVAIPVLYSTRESFPLPRYILVFVPNNGHSPLARHASAQHGLGCFADAPEERERSLRDAGEVLVPCVIAKVPAERRAHHFLQRRFVQPTGSGRFVV